MPLSIREIRQNTARARQLMKRARAEKFALGAFSLDTQETLKAVCRAAVSKKSPVLVEVSHAEAQSLGIENIRDLVDNYKRELNIEIYLNLDHSPSVQAAISGIESGFEFVHIDISQENPAANEEEIVAATKYVADYARLTGALVESEPQYVVAKPGKKIAWDEVKKIFSDPEQARQFADATGIDTYAAFIGNLHGDYSLPRLLDLELLRGLRASLDCGISLHGGEDIPDHYFREAINLGVTKVNVTREINKTFRHSLEKALKSHPEEVSVSKLMDDVIGTVQKTIEEKLDLFGSSGKA